MFISVNITQIILSHLSIKCAFRCAEISKTLRRILSMPEFSDVYTTITGKSFPWTTYLTLKYNKPWDWALISEDLTLQLDVLWKYPCMPVIAYKNINRRDPFPKELIDHICKFNPEPYLNSYLQSDINDLENGNFFSIAENNPHINFTFLFTKVSYITDKMIDNSKFTLSQLKTLLTLMPHSESVHTIIAKHPEMTLDLIPSFPKCFYRIYMNTNIPIMDICNTYNISIWNVSTWLGILRTRCEELDFGLLLVVIEELLKLGQFPSKKVYRHPQMTYEFVMSSKICRPKTNWQWRCFVQSPNITLPHILSDKTLKSWLNTFITKNPNAHYEELAEKLALRFNSLQNKYIIHEMAHNKHNCLEVIDMEHNISTKKFYGLMSRSPKLTISLVYRQIDKPWNWRKVIKILLTNKK